MIDRLRSARETAGLSLSPVPLTLASLPQLYAAARITAASAPTVREPAPNVCRYCGKFWRPWPATQHETLNGHARCVVPRQFQAQIAELYWSDASVTIQKLAEACGVSTAAVSSWLGRRRA